MDDAGQRLVRAPTPRMRDQDAILRLFRYTVFYHLFKVKLSRSASLEDAEIPHERDRMNPISK